jgi:hypothetical protein
LCWKHGFADASLTELANGRFAAISSLRSLTGSGRLAASRGHGGAKTNAARATDGCH